MNTTLGVSAIHDFGLGPGFAPCGSCQRVCAKVFFHCFHTLFFGTKSF